LPDNTEQRLQELERQVRGLTALLRNIQGSGLTFRPGQIVAEERNIVIDKNGITFGGGDALMSSVGLRLFADATYRSTASVAWQTTVGSAPIAAELYGLGATTDILNYSGFLNLRANAAYFSGSARTSRVNILHNTDQILNTTVNYGGALGGTGAVVWNEDGTDIDHRIEGNGNANLVSVDAGLDAVGIGGAPTANVLLDVVSTTKAFRPPVMTSTERDAIPSPVNGMIIWNSTTTQLEDYNGGWAAV